MKKTFQFDDSLPSLPLPTLEHTLERYLDSVRAAVDAKDYAQTEQVVEQFAKGIGRELHEQLKSKIEKQQERNWLARWWDEEIYMKWRLPIAPTINMMGFNCFVPPKADSQLECACVHMHACALVFETLREERYPISYAGKDPLTMYQLKHFFNTCRIPHRECDELSTSFRTMSEDARPPPTHVVLIRNGHLYTFDLYQSGNLLTPPEIRRRLEDIVERSNRNAGLGMGALTTLPRDEWADVREHLCQMNERNRQNLSVIEQALVVYAFDDENVHSLTELAHIGMLKNPRSRWFDRSILYIITRNGLVVTNSDHSAYEGVIPLQIGDLIQNHIDALEKVTSWPTTSNSYDPQTVKELIFATDTIVLNAIDHATALFTRSAADIDLLVINISQCTKDDIKQYVRIHPDTFFQLCLQLAYFKLHDHKPAPTYETASTRRFYRGRTETLRTCTSEVVAWCRAMSNRKDHYNDRERRKLFLLAAKRHQDLMVEASENQGCDRHLFGLSMIAALTGKPFELASDPSWTKSGGGGNFLLSTSCVGFGVSAGGTSAMCLNGYGVFYRIGTDATTFVVSAYRSCPDTNAQTLADSIERTLVEVKTLFMASNL